MISLRNNFSWPLRYNNAPRNRKGNKERKDPIWFGVYRMRVYQPGNRIYNSSLKGIIYKYDRNTVINILKKQGVPAPWVIIHLLYHSSHILRTTESMIILICEFHCTLRLKIHFLWQKYSTEINKTEWSWRHSFRITHEHDENGTSLNSWDKAHAFFWGKWTG